MRDFNMNATLASVLLHQQIGGKYEVNVQDTRKSNIPHGRSIKQGEKESKAGDEEDGQDIAPEVEKRKNRFLN